MSEATRVCVLHPARVARVSVVGILVCDECFSHYQTERCVEQGIRNRPFMQELFRAEYGETEDMCLNLVDDWLQEMEKRKSVSSKQ